MITENTFNDSRFLTFLREVDEVVQEAGTEQRMTSRVAESLARLLETELHLPEAYRKPRADRYVMYPLYVAPDESWSVAAAVWNVGQETPVHDHGVWGVVGISEGAEREVRYMKPTSEDSDVAPLAKLPDEDFGAGDVTICCTSDADIHAVSCASDIPCVGIHVYGGNIGRIERRTYDPASGEIGYFTSTWPDIQPAVVSL